VIAPKVERNGEVIPKEKVKKSNLKWEKLGEWSRS
jgi:hypothetical protein